MAIDCPKRAPVPVPFRLPDPPRPPAMKPSDGSAVPVSETAAGPLDAPPTVRLALLGPLRVFGAKATATSQLVPGCSVAAQPLEVSEKSAAFVPTRAAAMVLAPAAAVPS